MVKRPCYSVKYPATKHELPYSRSELLRPGPQPMYSPYGEHLDEIAFPLGGIGTGCVSLGGWGQLRDWEVMNRPAKGFTVPQAFFTLRAQEVGARGGRKAPVCRVLQGPVGGPLGQSGHSAPRETGEGLPHFREASFTGHFPFAEVMLSDPDLSVEVRLEAWSPFIPLNDRDSSLPVAVLQYHLTNTGKRPLSLTFLGNLTNVIGGRQREGRTNRARRAGGLTALSLSSEGLPATDPRFGSMCLATWAPGAQVWPRWQHDELWKFWDVVERDAAPLSGRGKSDTGSLIVRTRLRPGETTTIPVIITWHFPVFEKYWGHRKEGERAPTWLNYYATQWRDAWDVARYVAKHFARLHHATRLFHDALFSSTVPDYVLDASSSQLSILRSPTVIRLEDGTFYGFEGCSNTAGCCEGSCTHVWNYAQALAYLFPALQRSMLEASLRNAMQRDGFVHFRMPLPPGTKPPRRFFPAADGQMGQVMQVYREWLISGDEEWLRRIWPLAKRALEFAWKYWDADRDGVMEGMQHNTYDIEFYGPNTMCGSLYLGALRAAEVMARAVGEEDAAERYRALFERGSRWSDKHLWNGEYYEQKVEPRAHEVWPEDLRRMAEARGRDDRFRSWPKWQFGKGCLSDQLIGQWYAEMLGLGYLYDRRHVRKALKSIFEHNWKPDLSGHPCTLRVYAVGEEAGLIIATWPRGGRPGYPFYFATEVWPGIEYQVASHLIAEGFLLEGLAIVKGVRERHRGDRRNPWDEIECGHHYARSLASYALLAALAGLHYHGPAGRLSVRPRMPGNNFQTFFSVGSGWGRVALRRGRGETTLTVRVDWGELALREVVVPTTGRRPRPPAGKGEVTVSVSGRPAVGRARLVGSGGARRVVLGEWTTVPAGESLSLTVASGGRGKKDGLTFRP